MLQYHSSLRLLIYSFSFKFLFLISIPLPLTQSSPHTASAPLLRSTTTCLRLPMESLWSCDSQNIMSWCLCSLTSVGLRPKLARRTFAGNWMTLKAVLRIYVQSSLAPNDGSNYLAIRGPRLWMKWSPRRTPKCSSLTARALNRLGTSLSLRRRTGRIK